MPYIKQEDREKFVDILNLARVVIEDSPGELNYLITSLCHIYLENNGINYTNLNSVVGVLECAKLELSRKIIANYEDSKIKENGDVLPRNIK